MVLPSIYLDFQVSNTDIIATVGERNFSKMVTSTRSTGNMVLSLPLVQVQIKVWDPALGPGLGNMVLLFPRARPPVGQALKLIQAQLARLHLEKSSHGKIKWIWMFLSWCISGKTGRGGTLKL